MSLGHALGIPFRRGGGDYWTKQIEKDLIFSANSREGTSITDSFGNDISLLIPTLQSNGTTHNANTGVTALPSTIWVVKGKILATTQARYHGAQSSGNDVRFFFGTGTVVGTINLAWGNTSAVVGNNKAHDFDWHVFVVYDKRLWVLDKDTLLTDESILNIIAVETPLINLSTASWSGTETTIQYGRIALPTYIAFEYASSFIGTIADDVITWDRKHIFGGSRTYSYDIISDSNYVEWNIIPAAPLVNYSIDGALHWIDVGYSRYLSYPNKVLVPYMQTGEPSSSPSFAGTGYWLDDNIGNVLIMPDGKVRFVDDFFDRSNVTIWSNNARGTDYDAGNKKDFDGSKTNEIFLSSWLNEGYENRTFFGYESGDDKYYPISIYHHSVNKDETIANGIRNYIHEKIISAGVAFFMADTAYVFSWNTPNTEFIAYYGWKITMALDYSGGHTEGEQNAVNLMQASGHEIANHNNTNWVTYILENGAQAFYDDIVAPEQTYLNGLYGITPLTYSYGEVVGYDNELNQILFSNGFTCIRSGIDPLPANINEICYDGSNQHVRGIFLNRYLPLDSDGDDLLIEHLRFAKENNKVLCVAVDLIEDDYGPTITALSRIRKLCKFAFLNRMPFYLGEELLPSLFEI